VYAFTFFCKHSNNTKKHTDVIESICIQVRWEHRSKEKSFNYKIKIRGRAFHSMSIPFIFKLVTQKKALLRIFIGIFNDAF
jgi:hypothetical protein